MKNFSLPLEIPVKSFREIRDGLKSPETRGRAVSNLLVYLAGALLSFAVIFGAGYYFMAVTASGQTVSLSAEAESSVPLTSHTPFSRSARRQPPSCGTIILAFGQPERSDGWT